MAGCDNVPLTSQITEFAADMAYVQTYVETDALTATTPQGKVRQTIAGAVAAIAADVAAVDTAAASGLTNIAADVTSVQTATDEALSVEIPAQIARLGLQYPPIAYTAGLTLDSNTKTYSYNDALYIWGGALGTVTTGAFNETGWQPIQGDIQLRDDVEAGTSLIRDVKHVASVTALRALPGRYNGQVVELTSYYGGWAGTARGPVGGGVMVWDASRTAADDSIVTFAVTGITTGRWTRRLDGFVTPEMAGAYGNGLDDRAPLQSAVNYASQSSCYVLLTATVYGVASSGMLTGGKLYGVMLPSNCSIVSKVDTKIIAVGNEEFDTIVTDKDAATNSSNINLEGFHVDGNSTVRTANAAVNIALQRVTGLKIRDVYSLNSTSFGWRIQSCDSVQLSFSDSFQLDSAETNADGMHFIDTNNVTGSNLRIVTDSDDGFVIEAINGDVKNYTISDLYVRSKGRGVLLLVDETLTPESRVFKSIKISGIAENCLSTAVSLTEGSFEGIDIDIASDGCRNGLTLKPGTSSNAGYIRSCKFDINTRNCTQQGMFAVVTTGVIDDNEINLNVYNPGDGFNGVQFAGSNWRGNVSCNYDPANSKTNPATPILFSASSSTVTINAKGGVNSVIMQASADNNNISVGEISGGTTNSLRIDSGSTGNNFSSGRISGAITNNGGTSNVFNGVIGATFTGLVQVTPDANGEAVINHNVAGLPRFVSVNVISALEINANVIARSSTTISVKLRFAATDGLVTSGTYSVAISASI